MLHFDDVPGKRLVISRRLSELGCDLARVLSTRSETPADISSGTSFERSLSSYVIVAVGRETKKRQTAQPRASRVRLRLIRIHSSHDSAAFAALLSSEPPKRRMIMRNQLGLERLSRYRDPNWLSACYGKVRKGLSVARVPVHRRAARRGATSAELAPCGARSFTGGNARFPRMAALSSLHPRPACAYTGI